MSLSLKIVLIVLPLFVPFCQCISKSLFIKYLYLYNVYYILHNLDTVTVTYGGNNITNEATVDIIEEEDFNFTCSTSNLAADIAIDTDIDVPGSPDDSTRNFYLINVHRNLTRTMFTCTDGTDAVSFTINVLC